MTVTCEEPELIIATCDQCGDRRILDIKQDAEKEEIADAFAAIGWQQGKPERHRFRTGLTHLTVNYARDLCADCQTPEPAPKPLMRPARPYRPSVGIANDPCDEWPRSLVFAAVGLRPGCGHPVGGTECRYCRAGYPIGMTIAGWWR